MPSKDEMSRAYIANVEAKIAELESQIAQLRNHVLECKAELDEARNGNDRGELFDPVTAVSRYTGNGTYETTQRGRKRAGKSTGLSTTLTNTVMNASDAKYNRGGSQVLRGRIKQVLDL